MEKIQKIHSCLLCGSAHSEWTLLCTYAYYTEGEPITVELCYCRNCRLVFLSSRPKANTLLGHMEKATYTNQNSESPSLMERMRLFETILKLAIQWKPQKGRCLDVGCGYGYFLTIMREQGWEVYGMEMLKRLCLNLEAKGIPCFYTTSLENLDKQNFFNCITFIDALYYMPDPVKELRQAHRLLAKDGIIVLRVTNRALLVRILAPFHRYFPQFFYRLAGDALFLLSPLTLNSMLEKAGFSTISFFPDPRRGNLWPFNFAEIAYGIGNIIWKCSHGYLPFSPGLIAVAKRKESEY